MTSRADFSVAYVHLAEGRDLPKSLCALGKIASKISGATVLVSTVRRLSRRLDNPAVRVREWYAPIARGLLQAAADTVKEVRLIADSSKVGFGHQLLIISLAFRRRAIPLAWTWVKDAWLIGTTVETSVSFRLAGESLTDV